MMKDIINQFAYIEIKGHEWMMIEDVKIAMEQYAKLESQFQAFKADELEKQTNDLAAELSQAQRKIDFLNELLEQYERQ